MPEREDIGDDCWICRLLEHPKDFDEFDDDILWTEKVYTFSGRCCESHVWRKYAADIADVHRLGYETTTEKNSARTREEQYRGFVETLVRCVREIQHPCEGDGECYSFAVIHEPWVRGEFLQYHSHVCFCRYGDREVMRPPKNVRRELRAILAECFRGTFVPADSAVLNDN